MKTSNFTNIFKNFALEINTISQQFLQGSVWDIPFPPAGDIYPLSVIKANEESLLKLSIMSAEEQDDCFALMRSEICPPQSQQWQQQIPQ